MTIHVFAGPTIPATGIRAILPHAHCHPPARHGDLLALAPSPEDTVVIIDGLWHQSAPVRHKEILAVLAAGTTVVGAASMGALRAAELAPYGMHGVGSIYRDYLTGVLDADDEVAVLHSPTGEPLSEALVNIRTALARCAATGLITADEAVSLLAIARDLPYDRRSWPAIGQATRTAHLTDLYDRVNLWRRTNPYDLKREDAETALRLLAEGSPPALEQDGWRHEPWPTSFVRYWTSAYRPGPHGMPVLAALQYQQLYDPGFPDRWRRHVVATIGGSPATADEALLDMAAIRTAAEQGLHLTHLTQAQAAYWLTPAELLLDPDEALLRIMVRSARLDGAWTAWPATWDEAAQRLLQDAEPTAAAIAAAFRFNAAVAAADPRRTTAHLDPDRLGRHLRDVWGLADGATGTALDAAARDRAFRDFAGAVEVARAFYLYSRAATG
ncbi:TfuA-like protein [Kitasatospora sp. NPDC057500]|uniref:TfuA-like protein n=1 Tax=Kitasatospora sp. NPDC057500 TaxID=3346151 RepID=UPI0036A58E78